MASDYTSGASRPNQEAQRLWDAYTPIHGSPMNWPRELREHYLTVLGRHPASPDIPDVAFQPEQTQQALAPDDGEAPRRDAVSDNERDETMPLDDTIHLRQSGTVPAGALSPAQLASALQRSLAGHAHLRHAQVVASPGGLPREVQSFLLAQGLDPSRVKGVYTQGQSYLVGSNLEDVEDGIRTALHEVVGHEGVRALLGERFEPVMRQLHDSFPRQHDAWQTTAQRYGYLDTGTDAGKVAFAEELTAHLAETDAELGEFDMVKAEIRAQLRVQIPDLPVTEIEVKALIQRSRESLTLRHGSPEDIAEVRDRQARRQKVVGVVMESMARNGKGPDALSLSLYKEGSRVVDGDGIPCRLYHGAGSDVAEVRRGFWGTVDAAFANEYAAMRADQGAPASVVPFYAHINRPFDGDALKAIRAGGDAPDGLTANVFVEAVIYQAAVDGSAADRLRLLGRELAYQGRQEESGPTYSPHDFWYMPHWMFGRRGAEILDEIFEIAGFDGVRYTEHGHLTYGAFSPAQLHFLDQGASPRGWQPDRQHGEGAQTERPAFREWFGDSRVVEQDGSPKVMYHGTTGDITAFDQRKIRPDDLDAQCNGFWFSSRKDTSPAMRDATNVMPVYLAVENPAPYPLVREVAREVRRDKSLRSVARSADDEVRYRLQDRGFDGFFFTEPQRFTGEQRETFARSGELSFATSRGERLTLRASTMPEREFREVPYELDALSFENREGRTVTRNLAQSDDMAVVRDLVLDGVLALTDVDVMLDAIDKVAALRRGEAESVTLAGITLRRTTMTGSYPELVETGTTRELVDLYDEEIGHITSYASLEDYEEMHGELVAVAFRPEQIKSAIGNRGSFLRNHPDVRFDIGLGASPRIMDSANFREWFGASRLTHEDGEPLVLYHGTPREDFTVFDPDLAGTMKYADWGKGIYLTPDRDTADHYRQEAIKELDPVSNAAFKRYEALVKPVGGVLMDLPKDEQPAAEQALRNFRAARREAGKSPRGRVMPLYVRMENPLVEPYTHMPDPSLATYAQERGHDGIIMLTSSGQIDEVVVFAPEQLKSAIDNVGAFQRDNPDIRFSIGHEQSEARLGKLTIEEATDYFHGFLAHEIPYQRDRVRELQYQRDEAPDSLAIRRELRDAQTTLDDYMAAASYLVAKFSASILPLAGAEPPEQPQDSPARERIARVAAGIDINALREEIGELRDEGAYSEADMIERVAEQIDYGAQEGEPLTEMEQQLVDVKAASLVRQALASPVFDEWFEGSQVVDEQGAPLVVYHGTTEVFTEFSRDWIGEGHGAADLGEGFYFTNRPDAANLYARGDGGNVMPVYLDIKNPANLDVLLRDDVQAVMDDDMGFADFADTLGALGYDGIAVDREGGTEYVAFRPEQIRSAFDPSIDFARKRERAQIDLKRGVDESQVTDEVGAPEAIKPSLNSGPYAPASRDTRFGLAAYHGSAQRFDRFSMAAFGSGEGRHVFGHGLYFASREEVAQHYRQALGEDLDQEPKFLVDGEPFDYAGDIALRTALFQVAEWGWEGAMRQISTASAKLARQNIALEPITVRTMEAVASLEGKTVTQELPGGVYEVSLALEEDQLLDWERPMDEQPEHVQRAIRDLPGETRRLADPDRYGNYPTGGAFYLALADYFAGGRHRVSDVLAGGAGDEGMADASAELRDLGIPGLRYLDAYSRGAGKGSRNYVIFDDSRVTIENVRFSLAASSEPEPFDEWFSGSQVLDAEGEPLRVYLEAGSDLTIFSPGASFITQPDRVAAAGNVTPAYLSILRPYEVTSEAHEKGEGLSPDEARKVGYDGYVIRGQNGNDTYLAFDSSQIRHARQAMQGLVREPGRGSSSPIKGQIGGQLASARHQVNEGAPFARWFANSKVVGKTGEPLVVYHGTEDLTFSAFEKRGINEGFYFTPARHLAQGFAGSGGRVIEAHLSLQNPIDLRGDPDMWERFHGAGFKDWLEGQGFDGAIISEPEGDFAVGGEDVYIAFQPQQIKAARGNSGTFDPENPDIRFRLDQQEGQDDAPRQSAFREWFGESKVITEEGSPQVVYHGTRVKGITQFQGKSHPIPMPGDGYDWSGDQEVLYFSSARSVAKTYGNQVIDAYLSLQNPLEVDAQGRRWGNFMPLSYLPKAVADGHDGIIIRNIIDVGSGAEMADTFIAFSPEQIKSASQNVGTYDRNQADIRLSFAGEAAITAEQYTLDNAKRALVAGLDPEAVRQQTGWHRGHDGRWRFEIDDSQARLLPTFDTLARGARAGGEMVSAEYHHNDNGTYTVTLQPKGAKTTQDFIELVEVDRDVLAAVLPNELVAAIVADEGVDEWGGLLPEAGMTLRRPFIAEGINALPLSLVLDHPALFAAYPHLRELSVKVNPALGMGANFGVTEDGHHVITLGRINRLTNLLHELQHAVQDIEGFARGGSPDRQREVAEQSAMQEFAKADTAFREAGRSIPEVQEAYTRLEGLRLTLYAEHGIDWRAGDAPRQLRDVITATQEQRYTGRREAYYAAVEAHGGFDDATIQALVSAGQIRSRAAQAMEVSDSQALENYMRLAGEVEARNVQARMTMTPAQRQQVSPTSTQDRRDDEVLVIYRDQVQDGPYPANAQQVVHSSDRAGGPDFDRWFGHSVVVDDKGAPLMVFRGEHGPADEAVALQSRHGALSFGLAETASEYALSPNHRDDIVSSARVMPVYLSIEKPVVNQPDDPFLEMEDVIAALGHPLAERLAREMAEYIEMTDHWADQYAESYASVDDLLAKDPAKLADLYLQAYPVFDSARYVGWFQQAGYDGAVHGGSAVSAGEPEFKVFSSDQVRSALDYRGFASGNKPTTPADFDRWFGASQVVDDSGAPLTVYHGTQADFATFEKGDIGFHFAVEREGAQNRLGNAPGRILEVHLAIENPLRLDNDYGEFINLDNLRGMLGPNWDGVFSADEVEAWQSLSDVTQALIAKGYDGMVYPNEVEEGGDTWVAFRTEQINLVRSVPGVSAPSLRDIRLSIGPIREPLAPTPFERWFSASRVVDELGKPLVVYKGMYPYDWRSETPENPRGEEITAIDRPGPLPAFFEDDPGVEIAGFFGGRDIANHFGTAVSRSGAVYPVYLSLQMPYEVDAKGELAGNLQFGESGQAFREAMRSGKYDGAILHNTGDEGTVYIACRPDQVKSVFNVGTFDPARLDIRLSFAGEKARTSDRLTLDYAKRALAAGMAKDLIRQHSGWEQGADGQWRFEIDDSASVLATGEVSSSNPGAYLDWIEEASSREHGVVLSQVLDHPDLYAAYPQLTGYRVKVVEKGQIPGGAALDREARIITLVDPFSLPARADGVDPAHSALLHELQHAVQDIEGFAQGGMPADMGRILDEAAFARLEEAHDRLLNTPEAQANVERMASLREQWQGRSDVPDQVVDEVQALRQAPIARELVGLQRRARRMQADRTFGGTPYSGEELFDGYQRLGGEVEARNVQHRVAMSEAERQEVPPAQTEDVPRERQLLADAHGHHYLALRPDRRLSLSTVDSDNGAVVNATRSGARLQVVAESMLEMLDDAGHDHGWMDGGCRMLAEALRDWSDGKIVLGVTGRDGKTASHVVGVLALGAAPDSPCALVDADGLSLPEELSLKLDRLECSSGEQMIALGERAEELTKRLPMDEAVVCQAVMALKQGLGAFGGWQADLYAELGLDEPECQAEVCEKRETTALGEALDHPDVGGKAVSGLAMPS